MTKRRLGLTTSRIAASPDLILANAVCCPEIAGGGADAIRSNEAAGVHNATRRRGRWWRALRREMKTLFLIRHAKSSWEYTALPDKDRPLNDRGKRDAPKMGKRLAKRDVKPDLVLSSPARRALTTAEIIAKKLNYKRRDIVVDDRLYAGAVRDLLNVVHKLGDNLERVILFGHNPELTELAHRLSSEITHMPTCAVAEFTFNAKSWSHIGKPKLAKVVLDYPKKS